MKKNKHNPYYNSHDIISITIRCNSCNKEFKIDRSDISIRGWEVEYIDNGALAGFYCPLCNEYTEIDL